MGTKKAVSANAVFCDDIRQEVTGKFILVGVYGDELNMNTGPGTLPISIWLQLFGVEPGDHKARISFRKHVGKQSTEIASADVDMNVLKSNSRIAISLPMIPIHIDSDCTLAVLVKIEGKAPISAGELDIKAMFAQTVN
jgi:hypothetical protein